MSKNSSRRTFLKGAAVATTAAAGTIAACGRRGERSVADVATACGRRSERFVPHVTAADVEFTTLV